MSVSVVIVNWNSGALLERCLRAVSKQTRPPDAVFVVDNGSDDGSERCVSRYPTYVLLSPGRNLGFAGGNNLALRECETDYVVLVNPDAFLRADCLEMLIAAAEANPNFAAFGTRQMQDGNSDVLDGVGDVYHVSGKVWRRRHGKKLIDQDMVSKEIFSPCAATAMYRRLALREVGYFDDDFFCYLEDVDVGFRLRLAGYRALYVPEAAVSHVGSATTGGRRSEFATYHGHRNLVWTFLKNMPTPLFWGLLPLHIVVNLLAVVSGMLDGRGAVVLRAKVDALKAVRQVLRKRHQIQTRRRVRVAQIWQVLNKTDF